MMKFSVLISVYHKEDPLYLDEALCSIEKQTLLADEIVLVKDGPLTSRLDEVIGQHREYAKIDYQILELEKNYGLGIALQKGLEQCRYPWVARMDSDDIAMEDRFESQFAYLDEHPDIDIVGGWICEFELDDSTCTRERRPPGRHLQIKRYALYRNPMNHMTVVFRKSSVEEAGGYLPMIGFEDYYLWIRMLKRGDIFANLNKVLVKVRAGDEMISRRRGLEYIKREWAFEKAGREIGFFSNFELARNMMIRVIPRLMPPFLLEKVYNVLRKK